MRARERLRFRVYAIFAIAFAIMTVLTMVWPDWIEALTGFNPDHGNGSAEEFITAVFAGAAVLAGGLAGMDWRHANAAGAGTSD